MENIKKLHSITSKLFGGLRLDAGSRKYFRSPYVVMPISEMSDAAREEYDIKVNEGMFILDVEPGFEKYGAKPGDLILAVDGCDMSGALNYKALISELPIGTRIVFEFKNRTKKWSERIDLPSVNNKYDTVASEVGYRASVYIEYINLISYNLLNNLSDDNEIAYVLAHDLGHKLFEHARPEKQNIAGSLLALGGVYLGSKLAGSLQVPYGADELLQYTDVYTLDDEVEADRFAFALMRESGFEPKSGINVLNRFCQSYKEHKSDNLFDYGHFHNFDSSRIEFARAFASSEFKNGTFEFKEPPGMVNSQKFVSSDMLLGHIADKRIDRGEYVLWFAQVYKLGGKKAYKGMNGLVFDIAKTDSIGWVGRILSTKRAVYYRDLSGDLIDPEGEIYTKCKYSYSELYNQSLGVCAFDISGLDEKRAGVWKMNIRHKGNLIDTRKFLLINHPKGTKVKKKRSELSRASQ